MFSFLNFNHIAVNWLQLASLPLRAVRQIFIIFILVLMSCLSWGQDSLSNDAVADTVQSVTADTNNAAQANRPIASKTIVKNPVVQEGQTRKKPVSGQLFFIGLGVFLLFGLLRFFYNKYLHSLFDTLSRSSLQRLSGGEQLWQRSSTRLLFLITYFLSSGFIVGRLIGHFGKTDSSTFTLWMIGSGIMLGAFLYKYLMLTAVSVVFRFNKLTRHFFRHIIVINQILGVVLLPICGILLFMPPRFGYFVLLFGTLVLAASMGFKFLVNMGYVRNSMKLNYIHFIVYLCTLEFIPLAVLIRYAYEGYGG